MEPDDIQVANNVSIFHARDTFEDYKHEKNKRHILRLWLGFKKGRMLLEVYKGTREFGLLFKIPGRWMR